MLWIIDFSHKCDTIYLGGMWRGSGGVDLSIQTNIDNYFGVEWGVLTEKNIETFFVALVAFNHQGWRSLTNLVTMAG